MVVVVGAVVVSFLRLGAAGPHGVVWAEDGKVFLHGAYIDPFGSVFASYAGYGHLGPRLVALLVSLLPIAWHGVALSVAAGLV